MSAICGIFHLGGCLATRQAIEAMTDTLRHRGPHAGGAWLGDVVSLGSRILHVTPESLRDTQPATLPDQDLVLVADARIDNRRQLLGALGLPQGEFLSDSELILRAYQRWGTECPTRLLGDFAFAVYDARARRLFCARDPMGVKPLYYFASPHLFAFASEIKALLTVPEVSRRRDTDQIAALLEWTHDDRESTVYRDIKRLPAANSITVTPTGLSRRQYWSLDPSRELHYRNGDEYVMEFRELFIDAVRVRLRCAYPVGSTLSGGLDSSSITCVARSLLGESGGGPLQTYSLIFPDLSLEDRRLIDEREFMTSVIEGGNVEPHFVRGDLLSPLKDLDRILWHLDEPHFAPNLYLSWALYEATASRGARVLLDGLDGDTTVSHGFGRLAGLMRDAHWDLLESEIRAYATRQGLPPERIVSEFCLPYVAELARSGSWGRWSRAFFELSSRFGLSRRTVAVRYGLRPLVPTAVTEFRDLLADRRTTGRQAGGLQALGNMRRQWRARTKRASLLLSSPLQEREAHLAALTRPINQMVLELADRCASAFQVEPRYPFFDRRLIEFCLAVPAEQKFSDGWPRLLFRRAMQGILPPQVQWRTRKGNLTPNFLRTLRRDGAPVLNTIKPGAVAGHIDAQKLDNARSRFFSPDTKAPNIADATWLFRVATVATWVNNEETAVSPSTTLPADGAGTTST